MRFVVYPSAGPISIDLLWFILIGLFLCLNFIQINSNLAVDFSQFGEDNGFTVFKT